MFCDKWSKLYSRTSNADSSLRAGAEVARAGVLGWAGRRLKDGTLAASETDPILVDQELLAVCARSDYDLAPCGRRVDGLLDFLAGLDMNDAPG